MEPLLDDPALRVVAQDAAGVSDDEQAGGSAALLLDGGADVEEGCADDALVGAGGALEDGDGEGGRVALCDEGGDQRLEAVQRHEQHDGAAGDELGRVQRRALAPRARADEHLVRHAAVRGGDGAEQRGAERRRDAREDRGDEAV
ncbi:hypothetical protein B5807_08042 [Epicoccum nigrum]|uniref:Uncharacterized protein n=1 Tax=Epicoccum nigrum TaxID=105696 RepID=A0A1Y2LSX6_EPING|nr:hypothetical protein B5807_08042 [Epicoccum nigrum]